MNADTLAAVHGLMSPLTVTFVRALVGLWAGLGDVAILAMLRESLGSRLEANAKTANGRHLQLLPALAGSGHPVTWRFAGLAFLGAVFACVIVEAVLWRGAMIARRIRKRDRQLQRRATPCNTVQQTPNPTQRITR